MKPIERVSTILQHKEADRVPVYPLVNSVARKCVGATYDQLATDPELCAKAYSAITDELELDCICTLTDLSVEAADFGAKIIYCKDEAAHPDSSDRLLKSIDDYANVKRINPRETTRMADHIRLCELLMAEKGAEVPIVAFVFGPLGILSMLRGQAEIFMDLLDEPEALENALEEITLTLMDYCDALMETGVHAIMFDTLFASQSIMSKEMWKEFEGPYVKRLADFVHSKGCMVMIHNCGAGVYFDAQIELMQPEAISFLHVPDDCESFAHIKEKYGQQTTLIGHVSPGWLVSASVEEVKAECRKQIDTFKKDGGFVLATGCEYPASLDFEKARAMVETAKEYGRY